MNHNLRLGVLSILALALSACAPVDSSTEGDDTDSLDDEIRVCASGGVIQGIDVSEHNGHINWASVKKSGRVFAFARVSDGVKHSDSEFDENWQGIKAAGLVRGVYQYFRPGQDPIAQADLLISRVGTLDPDDLPPVIDVETANGQPTSVVVSQVKTWIDRVKAKTGRSPIIYAASGFWNTLPSTSKFAPQTLWVANYGAKCPSMPTTWSEWAFWQYSETGSVPGVSGGIDLDVFNGSLADLKAFAQADSGSSPACATDADCPSGSVCDTSGATPVCASDTQPPDPSACPALTYPSGVKIQTVANAAMTASYQNHLKTGETAPTCFLDVTNLKNPDTNETYTTAVYVAAHFQLEELVGTEVNQGYGNFVLANPKAVAALEAFRMAANKAVIINSGFRGPKHQEDVCTDICGNPLGCAGTCANNSRHMWGDAFDLPSTFYTTAYSDMACDAGFKFVYLESGTHLHVDQNPAYATCVQK